MGTKIATAMGRDARSGGDGSRTAPDERLAKAARYVAAQVNASAAIEIIRDLQPLLKTNFPYKAEANYFVGVAHEILANRRVGWERMQRWLARRHYRATMALSAPGSPFAVAATFALAASLSWDGRYRLVRKLLTPALQSSDTNAHMRANITLGVAAFRSRQIQRALDHWHTADALTPDNVSNFDPCLPGSWLHWAYQYLAEKALRQRKYERAYQYSTKLLSLHDMFIGAADFRLHATICEKARRREEALEALSTALALATDDSERAPEMHMGERRIAMPDWGYAYDRLYDDSGSFDSDWQK